MKEFFRKFFTKEVLIFLLLINTALHYMNFRFEKVDLPNSTKKLVIDTIKNEISFNPKCVNENCKKEVRNLENVLDEISYANQLGRLDTISLILALFGLVLGFGAIVGFLEIKETSRATAQETAQEAATKWLDSKSGKKQLKDSVYEWIDKNPKEMDKIFIKAAKVVNKAAAKSTPKKEISDLDEVDLIKAINDKELRG